MRTATAYRERSVHKGKEFFSENKMSFEQFAAVRRWGANICKH